MLAQNFRSPSDLKINDEEYRALITVLGMLERGECDGFDMTDVNHDCGTPSCILGWAQNVSGNNQLFCRGRDARTTDPLFFPDGYGPKSGRAAIKCRNQEKAAVALRSYLSTGKPCWAKALA